MNLFSTVAPHDGLQFFKGNVVNIERVREITGLDNNDLAKIAGVPKSSVRNDSKAPKQVLEHLENIANICNLVFEFFNDNVKTKVWLQTPNPMLGNMSPRDMIRFGRFAKLQRFVANAIVEGRTVEEGQKAAT
jgi:uncharacterized protein (DUF2384 family)